MPFISYYTETESKEELVVYIEYHAHTEKGLVLYEGAICCSVKRAKRRRPEENIYTFSFTRDQGWRFVTNASIYECVMSTRHDPFPVLQEVMWWVGEYERENN